jgi:putative restriction endonuclease
MELPIYIANTDRQWYDYLTSIGQLSSPGRPMVAEANFWFPSAQEPHITSAIAGTPVFLRLKSPHKAIAGVGFYASYRMLSLEDAWDFFGAGNGDPDREQFYRRIRRYRMRSSGSAQAASGDDVLLRPLACMVLRAVEFWSPECWIPWSTAQGYADSIVTGKFERDDANRARLLSAIGGAGEVREAEFGDRFQLVEADERSWRVQSDTAVREGQASFRLRLIDAYESQCAITGEHTTPVLDAAHIQPYLGRRSNHVQNGLLLTKEFHTLFDRGYVTVTPDFRVRVSKKLKSDFSNGRRYYPFDGQPLAKLPDDAAQRPSSDALDWHGRHVFRAG